jgi:hypothetical protein
MSETTIATAAEPDTTTAPGPAEVSDAELEDIVGGVVCCACADVSCRL